ncbi:MAG: UrcA family protein [Allosphingosinicella sp.]
MTKLITAAIAGALLVPAAAQAADPSAAPTASIRYDDLNLASPSGLATFNGRVKAAANRVCGVVPVSPFNEARAIEACRAQMFRSAAIQIALATGAGEVLGTR